MSTGDIDANELSLRERRIGFVFQHYAMFRHMTVLDNIASGLRARPTEHAILNKGVIEQVGTVREILERPVSSFVEDIEIHRLTAARAEAQVVRFAAKTAKH